MKPQDLIIEDSQVSSDLAQVHGTVCGHRFQFHAKYGMWEFAAFADSTLKPWVQDIPSDKHVGMYIIQPIKPSAMTEAGIQRIIARCAEGYLFLIGRRQSDLTDEE
jgi:hypothetical protein